ncbi:MAG: DegT/DnrJ/EryC1/StrS family aminotransferase [Bacteroidales bacterium]|nr:DegT/DnrJ/EryC1/StrS family aminotransferase [Bacteroidales bacterium]MDD3961931.1 DegT/DnrJ/EryC1/StrS family aminotransferase [Bacteroidales bacterium]MDY0286635.1 DegT/DnrJ/EryC1/StrS family aminotransferase [Bacteroidales bacterium]
MKNNRIFVTQPVLPPLEEFIPLLQDIWKSKHITNNGPYHQELEKQLANYLGVPFISLFSNGTLALLTALQCLNIKGEVITTPYSFVATTHALWWNNIKPVFADIEPEYCNLDPEKVEAAITPETTAILPVHVYGNPCNHEKLKDIADRHNLRLIYDAAHAFGVKKDGHSILNWGDLSILSFHATKVYNTIEGGAIVSHDAKTKERIDHLKNFGFTGETTVVEPGINAKMNELQAAYGLLQLKTIDRAIAARKKITEQYREGLKDMDGVRFLEDIENVTHNYAYFPVFIEEEKYGMSRDALYEKLKANGIHGRRYFYPLINSFEPYKNYNSARTENLFHAHQLSSQVICLPLYEELCMKNSKTIINIIKETRI